MQMGRDWGGGGAGWEGRLHGKLLVLIQHVEQGSTFQQNTPLPPPPPPLCQVVHTHTNKHMRTNTLEQHALVAPSNKHHKGNTKAYTTPLPVTHINTPHLFLLGASKQTWINMWTNPTILRPTVGPQGVIPGCFQWDNNKPQRDRPVLPPKDRLITRSSHGPWLRLWNLC